MMNFSGRLIPGLGFLALFTILVLCGCSRQAVLKNKMVFDLDDAFKKKESQSKSVDQEEDWKEKGLTLVKEKNFQEAIEAFKRHVEKDAENFFGFNAMAVCYKNLGDQSMAMKYFERALEFAEQKQDKAKVLANIGNLYLSRNQPQAALGYYKEATKEYKDNPLYLILIARGFIVLREFERARKVLLEAEQNVAALKRHEDAEDKGTGYYLMAYCFLGTGEEDRDKVSKYLKLALDANPTRFVPRLRTDLNDGQNLFFTLRDEEDIQKLLAKYPSETAKESGLDSEWMLQGSKEKPKLR